VPNSALVNSVAKRFSLILSGFVIAIALIAPGIANAAENEPNITLGMSAPKNALLGTKQTVTLTAKNPAGEKRGYNLSFRDVLPKGVHYVAGSAKGPNGEPVEVRVLTNLPNPPGTETTLLIENVSDLSQNSEYKLTYEVEPDIGEFGVNASYENHATAYVSRKARFKPKFNSNGEVIEGEESFKGSASAKAKTTLTAIEIEKAEPSPEGEILRGVHEHQVVYTLHLRNNDINKTTNLKVADYLPAGLEFLGCGQVDHTKKSPTTGTTEEYEGSGPIFPGNKPAAPKCEEPSKVETVEIDPDGAEGPLEFGVYTFVEWENVGELAAGAEKEIQYRAAIPIRENTMTWSTGVTPTGKSLEQAANLDNNSGNETFDEEPLVNYTTAKGKYNGITEVEAENSLERTAEDLAIQKSVTPGTIAEGQLSKWTFNIETSEYRYVNNIKVEDVLPNGLCPIGKENYEFLALEPEKNKECEPEGELPTSEYSKVQENSDGTWNILWEKSTVSQLEHMAPSTEFTITFPTRTRTFYQKEFKDSLKEPVLTGDSWTNKVETVGENYARCIPNSPVCKVGDPTIPTSEKQGEAVKDTSSASQQAGGVTIDKSVRENIGVVPADCEGTYVQGLVKPLPSYAPGDKICWQLVVNFATDLYAGTPAVTDFLPPNEKYVPNSAAEVKPPNNVESTIDESEAEGGALEWTLGESVSSGSKVWEWRFATEMGTSIESKPEDVTGNLMKFVYSNHFGQTFPLRDRAEIEREEPELQLAKGVYSVGGKPAGGNPADQNATGAHGGEKVKYRLDLKNVGNLVAENIELWDRLPKGIECSDLVTGSISNGGTCEVATNIIVWTGLEVPAGESIPSVTYELTLPTDVAPNQTYVNEAGVRQFESPTNTGGHFSYYPTENIDPKFEETHKPNTEKIKDPATVTTEEVGLTKTRTTSLVQEEGNNAESQATIGETVNYTVKAEVPAGSSLFKSPTLTDPLGTRLLLVPGSAKGKVKVGGTTTVIPNNTTTAGFKATENGNEPVMEFPETFVNPPGGEAATVTLEFSATVADVAANNRLTGSALTNVATLEWHDQNEVAKTKTAEVTTTVVEPLVSIEKTHAGSETVKPGEVRAWTVTAKNAKATNVSTANDSIVEDTVPNGLTPWKGGEPGEAVANGGFVGPEAQGGKWNATTRTITWTITELAPGASKKLEYELRVNEPANAGSIFKNKATIKTTSMPGTVAGERTSSSASHAGYEASKEAKVQLNDAELEKSVEAPEFPTIGSPLKYTLHLKLPPSITFFDTTVEDQLPKGVEFGGTTSIKCAPGCEEVEKAGKTLTPKVTGGAQLLGWYFGKIESAEVGRTVTITYTAHIASEVGGEKIVDKAKLENKAIGLYSGEAKLKTVPTEPPARGEFTNKTNEPNAKVEVKEPKLEIKKAETGATAAPKTQPGDEYTYTLTVTNKGDAPAYDVEVNDDNPQGVLREVNPKGIEGEASLVPGWKTGDPLVWIVKGPIAAGASVNLKYTAKLAPSAELHQGDKIENIADIPLYYGASEEQRLAEPTTEKEEEEGKSRYREYEEDPSSTVTLETALPKLELEKTVGPESAKEGTGEIGKPVQWHLKVTNSSTVAALNAVTIVDTLPEGFGYKVGSTTGLTTTDPAQTEVAGHEVLTWTAITNLPAGGPAKTLNFEAIPTILLENKEAVYTNEAVATGKDASGATASAEGPYEAEDSAKVKLLTPGLQINKTPDVPEAGSNAVAGEEAAYEIEVKNTGKAVATEVEVTDTLGKGNEYTAGTATANPNAGFTETKVETLPGGETEVTWKIASIAKETGKVVITVPVQLASTLANETKLVDNASVKSAQETTPKEDEGSLLVHRQAKITFEKKGPATVVAGEQVEYELVADNPGPSVAEDVTIKDPVPAGLKFVKADAPCALVGTEVVCELGTVAVGGPGQVYHVTFEVLPATTGTVTNVATLETPTENPELEPGEVLESEVPSTVETEAEVTIDKTGPTTDVLLGGTFAYNLEVENKGPSDALEVDVVDPLPTEVEALSVETDTGTCEPAAPTIECELGTLIPGQKAKIVVTVKAVELGLEGGKVVNTATVTSPTDPTPGESTAEVKVDPAADLAVVKTGPETVPAGGEITYGLHVENKGPSDATGVKVTDPLPAGTQFVSASEGCAAVGTTVTCEVGELKVGESRDYKVTIKAPLALAGQSIVNTATVKGEQADPVSENDQSTVTTNEGPAADLAITKTMGKAEAGKPLVYTLAITNKGPSTSSAVTVKDTLPAGTTFKSAAPSQGTCSAAGQLVTCQLGALASGGSAQVSITVEVGATVTGNIRNTASVEGPEPDPDPSNNESSVEGPVTPAPAASTGVPNLKVVKTADNSTPEVGVPFDYDVAISNSGTAEAKNVKVVDTLSGPVKVISIEAGTGKCNAVGSKIECTIPSVPVGKTVHVTYSVVAESAGPLSNTASAMAANGEKSPANNHAVKGVRAKAAAKADFTLTKTASRKVVLGGKKVGFTIALKNGAAALTNAKVCDRLPAALVFVKATGASFVKGEACWTEHYVAPHKVLHLHLTARAVKSFKARKAKNVASASAGNVKGTRKASATVRIKPVFAGAPGGVTG
jgi:large repetitive protein